MKIHNLNADQIWIYLTNIAPVATNTVYNTPADLTTGYGYTAGGVQMLNTGWSQASGIAKLSGANVVFTATGNSIGPFRYAVMYNFTASAKNLIGWWDYGSSISLNSGESFTVAPIDTTQIINLA